MEEGHFHYHHHHHRHHHGHDTSNIAEGHGSQQEIGGYNQITEQQRYVSQPAAPPVIVPRAHEQPSSGVQATGSFHSVSSIDSSAEMARYFPDPQTPTLSPFRYQQNGGQHLQQSGTSSSIAPSSVNMGPYAPVPVPQAVQPPIRQPLRASGLLPQQQATHGPAAPQLAPGIPSYTTQIEGLSVSQAIVNDVIVDLQSKVINETQQQYNNESANSNFLETLSPIYIRAPNPTIILRSDLHRLRAQMTARPPGVIRPVGGINQFQQNTYQVPSFPPPPQQHLPPECYGEYHNQTHVNT